jgi:hypothetical protein
MDEREPAAGAPGDPAPPEPGEAEPRYVEANEMFRTEAIAAASRVIDEGKVLKIAPRRLAVGLWATVVGLAIAVIAMSVVSVDRAVTGFVVASQRNGLAGTAVFPGDALPLLQVGQPLELRDRAGSTQTVVIERVEPTLTTQEQLAALLPAETPVAPQRGSLALVHVSLSASQALEGEIVHARVVVGRESLLAAMIPELRRVLP